MKRLLMILLCLLPMWASAQQLIACRDSIQGGYDFWLYLPEDYDPEIQEKPVVMFLHGKSLCGHQLSKVRRYGCIDAITRGRQIDAVVVAPQTSGAWNPKKVMDVYKWVSTHYAVDTNRLYVLGMSLGGYGTLDFTATYPDKVAAAMAMCGGASMTELCGLNDVPLWIVHGTADKAVPVRCSQSVVDAMTSCGDTSRLIFSKLYKVNHSRLARVFYLEQTYDWLFAHSLSDSVRLANKDYSMSTKILDDAYSNLNKDLSITIIDPTPSTYKVGENQYYIVKKGDTLSSIAVEYHTTVLLLCKLNQINKNSVLRIGQKIRVS